MTTNNQLCLDWFCEEGFVYSTEMALNGEVTLSETQWEAEAIA